MYDKLDIDIYTPRLRHSAQIDPISLRCSAQQMVIVLSLFVPETLVPTEREKASLIIYSAWDKH